MAPKKQKAHSSNNAAGETNKPFIVGIGASAGGLDSFRDFFKAMPSDSGMAFVLVQHLDPHHDSMMVDLLSRYTDMTVKQAESRLQVKPDHVYMIPPNHYLSIRNGVLQLGGPLDRHGARMSVDRFFQSLADDQRESCIGIVLSGTGTDGTQGLRAIKDYGGMTLVQSPETTGYDGMVRSAIGMSAVDFVVPIEEMPNILMEYARRPDIKSIAIRPEEEESETDYLDKLVAHLRARSRYDLRCYKKSTLTRRIYRRMRLRNVANLKDYLELLRNEPDEPDELFNDLLIGVTQFYRDPDAWKELEEKALPELIKNADENRTLRIWVPGCSTGQEAYGLAMSVTDAVEKADRRLEVQVFATDVDNRSLEFARRGVYAESIEEEVPPARLKAYFRKEEQNYVVSKQIRDKVVFAAQNLVADPPFSKIDLISCRNLMIYLESNVQERVLRVLHFALSPQGFLFLGTSESLGKVSEHFKTVSKKWRIYQRKGTVPRPDIDYAAPGATGGREAGVHKETARLQRGASERYADMANEVLLDNYAPASVVLTTGLEVLYMRGPIDRYLRFPTGELTHDLMSLLRDGISSRVRAVIQKARENADGGLAEEHARVRRDDGYHPVTITVRPLSPAKEKQLLLVSFADQKHDGPLPEPSEPMPADETVVRQLEMELKNTRSQMAAVISDLETANEELKASNEEIMSMNEEFQSTNEELETSREELQSLNEELTTVNNQLEEKVQELETANNDLRNLLASSEIAVIFLDSHLRIKRYTESTKKVLRLIPSDVGRPVSDIAHTFEDFDLPAAVQEVSDSLNKNEHQVRSKDNRWYTIRILPYRTEENKVEGVVLTFSDVTGRKNED